MPPRLRLPRFERLRNRVRRRYRRVLGPRRLAFDRLPPELVLRYGYNVVLRREPDPTGEADFLPQLENGALSPAELVDRLRGSEEYQTRVRFNASALHPSLHAGRCQFVRGLPPARRILDLGGTHVHRDEGALVALGYPYDFDELVVVDLPPDERHGLYHSDELAAVQTERGPVRYAYHSMSDLSAFADGSFDLVYSGQSIEHVPPGEADVTLKEVFRVLRPGSHLALDTPNGPVCRLQQEEFIDPDHDAEYSLDEITAKLQGAGFEVVEARGINYAGESVASGRFSLEEVAGNQGLYFDATRCYLLALLCRKPA